MHALFHKTIDLPIAQDSAVLGEVRQVDVTLQQFLRFAAVAIVERVDEIKAHGAADKLESRSLAPRKLLMVWNNTSSVLPYYLTIQITLTS